MRKSELRQLIRERKRPFIRQQLDVWSLAIQERLMQHPRIVNAPTIMLYHALPDEVSTLSLLDAWQDKTLLLPRVIDGEQMELRRYTRPDDLKQGAFGIMEPCGELFTDYSAIDVAIVPGMAFDAAGHRLGRGKGYYDRFLSLAPSIYKIGICFPFQLVDNVPVNENDVWMNEVIT